MIKKKRWFRVGFLISLGSAFGALGMGAMIRYLGHDWLDAVATRSLGEDAWQYATQLINQHGSWAIALGALGPFPLQPFVILGSLGHFSIWTLFFAVLVGRLPKYLFFAWAATHAPRLVKRFIENRI